MDTTEDTEYKRKLLITFINQYLSKKDIKMKSLLNNVKRILEAKRQITIKQFLAIIRFVEREGPFRRKDRKEILEYFFPLIRKNRED